MPIVFSGFFHLRPENFEEKTSQGGRRRPFSKKYGVKVFLRLFVQMIDEITSENSSSVVKLRFLFLSKEKLMAFRANQ